ncbi:MAG: isochorismatase family protein [Sphingopyxis sp.]
MSDDRFTQAGYGGRPVGFGTRAAVLMVDFQLAFTDARFPMGRSDHVGRAVDQTAKLLDEAERLGVLVAACNVGWADERGMPYWKASACYQDMAIGDEGLEFDPRIDRPGQFRFTKAAPSAFFGTPLVTFLVKQRIDTVIVTGCTTGGCVRATIVDAFSYGFRVIVPESCCGDQDATAHAANLADVDRRYADVLTLDAVIEGLRQSVSNGQIHG